jgi:hypothetical protein
VPRRRLATLAAVLAVAGLAATGCASQSAALRVGDETVSQSELFEELALITHDQGYRSARIGDVPLNNLEGPVPGSFQQNFVASILQDRVTFLVADDVLADHGIELTDQDRQAVANSLDSTLPPTTKLPARLKADLVDGVARVSRLRSELGEQKANAALFEAETKADVKVNSRFGRWDADTLSVIPPPGAVSGQGSSSATGSGSSGG